MSDQALRPQPESIIWNDTIPSHLSSFGSPNHTSLEAHSLGNQYRSLDTATSRFADGSLSGSPTLGNIFFAPLEEREDQPIFLGVSGATLQPGTSKTVACESCRKRKRRCGVKDDVQRRNERGRSALLMQDQCHRASKATRSELLDELGATKMNLFIKEEELKEMRVWTARLEKEREGLLKERRELLERLGHPPVRVSGCYAYLVHSDDLTPHQATSHVQHGIW